jgi:hypothetical protein
VIKTLRMGGPEMAGEQFIARRDFFNHGPHGPHELSRTEEALKTRVQNLAPGTDYLLLDSGAGSGKPFDWALLAHWGVAEDLAPGRRPSAKSSRSFAIGKTPYLTRAKAGARGGQITGGGEEKRPGKRPPPSLSSSPLCCRAVYVYINRDLATLTGAGKNRTMKVVVMWSPAGWAGAVYINYGKSEARNEYH